MKKYILFIGWAVLIWGNFNCKKFVQISPPSTELASTSVFATNSAAISALNGIYVSMEGNSVGGGSYGISAILGLSGDDFNFFPGYSAELSQVYTNSITSASTPSIWFDLYNLIYQANSVIQGASGSTVLSPTFKNQLIGEAEFVRAFCYFYLVNIYGNIPLVTSTDYAKTAVLGQSSGSEVYGQVVFDLRDAYGRLGTDYLNAQGTETTERVRPNNSAVAALLARVYLYNAKYDSAEQEANLVIGNSNYVLHQYLDSVFMTSSQEAIWQLELPMSDLFNTSDGGAFLPGLISGQGPNSNYPYSLSSSLMADFEPNDLRRAYWTDSLVIGNATYYFPFKYQLYYTNAAPAEYPVILRLAEQYLIRAEARAHQGNLAGAIADLNVIRNRAGLDSTVAVSQQDILKAIAQERRVELFTEYGHRWMDIKRTDAVDSVMTNTTAQKGGSWVSTDSLYPIPVSEIKSDPNLKQNPGYQ